MKRIIIPFVFSALLCSCSGALDPLVHGAYTEENYQEYPTLIRGFVDEAYSLLPTHYNNAELAYSDCATEDGVTTSTVSNQRRYALGTIEMTDDPFLSVWERDYTGIYYVNRFLRDRVGINTQYLIGAQEDRLLRRNYQGDAYALRAWFEYDLLLKFGGRSVDGELLGFPLLEVDFDKSKADVRDYPRKPYDECVRQILDDCDSALVYLPRANRNWLAENTTVQGSARWEKLDGISVTALKALVYLLWASPAYNPSNDMTRWEKAAEYAAQAIEFKLKEDFPHAGKTPLASFSWTDPNSHEAFWTRYSGKTDTMEKLLYPDGFQGTAAIAPSQNLVDAFPMANGYPITDSRSGYDPKKPYEGRDPRFYATIFYDGSSVVKSTKVVSYAFDCSTDGADCPGLKNTSLTGYYLKKFTYSNWKADDKTVETMPRAVFFLSWRDMCLAFAEAANRAWGPSDSRLGLSAKDALAYIRCRTTADGTPGLGVSGDLYLDECARSKDAFEALVRNERRIEFCFEGKRLYDLARWNTPLEQMNTPVYGIRITRDGESASYVKAPLYTRNYKSVFLPMPYGDVLRSKGTIVQNEGWETWK